MAPSNTKKNNSQLEISPSLLLTASYVSCPLMFGRRRLQASLNILLRHSVGLQRIEKTRSVSGQFKSVGHVKAFGGKVLGATTNEENCEGGRNWDGEKLLMAAKNGNLLVAKQILLRNADHAKYAAPATGITPLAAACEAGHDNMVKLLLEHEADPYSYTPEGVSPLMLACRGGHASVVKRLLEAGADAFHLAYDTGRNALMDAAAVGSTQCVKLLLEQGYADVRSATEETGTHALLEAALYGHLGTVKALLTAGAKVNQTDKAGHTALLISARRGDSRMVEVLLQHKAKSIAEFDTKRTPLMEAACNGHTTVVAMLLAAEGTDTQAVDAYGSTALTLAGTPQVRALLQTANSSR